MITSEALDIEVESAVAEARPHLKAIYVTTVNGEDGKVDKHKREVSVVTLSNQSFNVEVQVGRGWREIRRQGAETVLYPSLHQLLMNRTSGSKEYMKSFHELLVGKIRS